MEFISLIGNILFFFFLFTPMAIEFSGSEIKLELQLQPMLQPQQHRLQDASARSLTHWLGKARDQTHILTETTPGPRRAELQWELLHKQS